MTYGHAEKGEVAIEIVPRDRGCKFTLMLLCSIEGIDYAKIIPGAAITIDFLAFWGEAARFLSPFGRPLFANGSNIAIDNCPIHRFDGAEALAEFLMQWGTWLVFLPNYSPEFNAAELVFGHMKKIAKWPGFRRIANDNLEAAFYGILASVDYVKMNSFYRSMQYFRI